MIEMGEEAFEQFLLKQREYHLLMVDAIETLLRIKRTVEIRKEWRDLIKVEKIPEL